MKHLKKAVIVAVALAGLVLTTAADCDDDSHDSAPDPTPGSFVDLDKLPGSQARGIKMPDGFRNIIIFCDGTTLVYETSRGAVASVAEGTVSNLAIIPNDPRCAK